MKYRDEVSFAPFIHQIMLTRSNLKKISESRLREAGILIKHKRYSAAVYMAGYAVELKLKLKICEVCGFKRGYPKFENEFNAYRNTSSQAFFRLDITRLRQLKIHDLNNLLKYSGKQLDIFNHFSTEWSVIKNWSPQQRYSTRVIRKATADEFLKCCSIIIENL